MYNIKTLDENPFANAFGEQSKLPWFSTDDPHRVLIWHDTANLDGEEVPCLHTAEMDDYRIEEWAIFGYEMPETNEEYEEILEAVRSGDPWGMRLWGDW